MMADHQELGLTSTLARGLMVLELVAVQGLSKGISLQEISKSLEIPRSNAYRYVTTLCEDGWLKKDPETYRYHVGWKTLQIAGASLQAIDLRTVARPFLERLAEETCFTVHLAILTGASIMYIDKVESNSPIQMRSRPGMTAPCYCTAVGKAMLATMPPGEVRKLLKDVPLTRRTAYTLTTMEDLLDDLSLISERGFSLDSEENEENIGCVGAAIFDYDNEMVGGISVSALIQQLDKNYIGFLGREVKKVASEISQSMGCHRNHSQKIANELA
jgi:IclR family transcriptional regulator, KDG regulon repressor